jgi:hypothetical protein
MADRKQFLNVKPADSELLLLLEKTKHTPVTEAQFREQRISFAFGNAMGSGSSTKEDVRLASQYLSFANPHAAKTQLSDMA